MGQPAVARQSSHQPLAATSFALRIREMQDIVKLPF
jgi:hypothetical protein